MRLLAPPGKVMAAGYLAGLNPRLNLESEFWKLQACAWLQLPLGGPWREGKRVCEDLGSA